jgi:hypothetical protein
MNTATEFAAGLAEELRAFLVLCQDALELIARENRALSGQVDYQSGEFHQSRKGLLPNLESALIKLRRRRQLWKQAKLSGVTTSDEIKTLFQAIQSVLMKALLLDRENQQAMLRRGLVPARHLPPAEAQQPHYVASLYRRHATRATS